MASRVSLESAPVSPAHATAWLPQKVGIFILIGVLAGKKFLALN